MVPFPWRRKVDMQFIGDLKNTGLKATLPRITILELFQKSGQRHMSAEDVYRLVLNERADIGLATIYRVLMQFEQAGLLTRSQFEGGKAVYEIAAEWKSFLMRKSKSASTI
jgi:Fur family ferric uptake transcriptional regulator